MLPAAPLPGIFTVLFLLAIFAGLMVYFDRRRQDCEKHILSALEQAGQKGLTVHELEHQTGVGPRRLWSHLERLLDAKRIERQERYGSQSIFILRQEDV